MAAREILARFVIDDDGSVTLERIGRKARKAGDDLESVGRRAKGAGSEIESGTRQGAGGVDSLKGSISKLVGGVAAIYAVKAAFDAVTHSIGAIINVGARFEMLEGQLTSITGSAEAAGVAVSWIKDFGATTPHELEQVTRGFVRLKAYGLDPMDGTLDTIGDAVAAMGGNQETFDRIVLAVGQMATKGKLAAQELRQLAENGIPAYQILSEKLGLTAEQVSDIGNHGVGAAEGIRALFEGLEERYGGAMAEQMTRFTGILSNAKDQVTLFLQALAKGGVLDAAKEAVSTMGEAIQTMVEDGSAAAIGEMLGQSLSAALPFIEAAAASMQTIGNVAKALTVDLRGYGEALNEESREQEAFAEAVKISHGSVKLFAQQMGMTSREVFDYYMSLEKSGKVTAEWAQISGIMHALLEEQGDEVEETREQWAGLNDLLSQDTPEAVAATNEEWSALIVLEEAVATALKKAKAAQSDFLDGWIDEWIAFGQDFRGEALRIEDNTDDLVAKIAATEIKPPKLEPPKENEWVAFDREIEKRARAGFFTAFASGLDDAFSAAFSGDLGDGLFGIVEDTFSRMGQVAGQSMSDSIVAFFDGTGGTGSLWDQFKEGTQASRGASIAGGAYGVYSAYQSGDPLSGAISGAIAGTAIAPGIGTAIGAIVGGLVGLFGGGDDPDRTQFSVGPDGAHVSGSGGNQNFGTNERRIWEGKIDELYRSLESGYRSALEAFGDASLFELLGSDPTFQTIGDGIGSAEVWAQLLADEILPDGFDRQFRAAFSAGLRDLGVTHAMIDGLNGALADLPAAERLTILTDYVTAIRDSWELLEGLGDLHGAATQNPAEAWAEAFGDVMNSVDVLLAGWGSMDFDAQISQGRQAVDLLGVWYDSAVGYLGQLIALQGSMHDGIGRARENLMLEGMNDAEKRSYAHRGLNQSLMEISHARTGEDLQAAYDDFMRFWQIYKEVGGAGNSGSLFWWLDRADAAVDTASERIQDPIQEQADAAADALGEVIERLTGTDPDSMTWALQQVTDGMSTTSQAMSDFELAITGGSGGLVRFNELIQRVNDTLGGLGYGGGYDDPVTPSQPIDSDAIATGIARGLALASTGGAA
jgi:tape measure domain-containing protein